MTNVKPRELLTKIVVASCVVVHDVLLSTPTIIQLLQWLWVRTLQYDSLSSGLIWFVMSARGRAPYREGDLSCVAVFSRVIIQVI